MSSFGVRIGCIQIAVFCLKFISLNNTSIVGSPRILKGGGLKSLKIVKGWEFTFFH